MLIYWVKASTDCSQFQYDVTGFGTMSSAWDMIPQWGSKLKRSFEPLSQQDSDQKLWYDWKIIEKGFLAKKTP